MVEATLTVSVEHADAKIRRLRTIVSKCQMTLVLDVALPNSPKVDVDLYSASAIMAVYDNLSEPNQAKYVQMPLAVMADIAFKLINK